MSDTAIRVKELEVSFYSKKHCRKVVNGISLHIRKGRTLCVVGESGCGKSVTASAIMQLLPKSGRIENGSITYYGSNGQIQLENQPRNGRVMRSIRGRQIAMIFQEPMTAFNPVYSIGYQIIENIIQHKTLSRRYAKKKAIRLLGEMGIPLPARRINEYPHQLSGGMLQRAMIAMAMSCAPEVLIADEPTTALDVTIQAQVFELIGKLKQEHNMAVMLITHDMGVVTEIADDVSVMYMGNIVEQGTVQDVIRRPRHPYTRKLLDSIPILGRGKNQKLKPIRGSTPDPYKLPPGCQFAPRCDYVSEHCSTMPPETPVDVPGLVLNNRLGDGEHTLRCWNWKEADAHD